MEPLASPTAHAVAAPRTLGQLLDAGFDVVRRQGVVLVGLSALLYVPAAFVEALLPDDPAQVLAARSPALVPALLALLFVVLVFPIVVAAVTDACGEVRRGRTVDAGQALRAGLALAWPLCNAYLVVSLVALAAAIPLGLVVAFWSALGVARVPAALFAAALPAAVMLRFSLLTQVAVLERLSGAGAVARASRLIEGQVLRVFGIYAVVGLLMALLGGAAGIAVGALPTVGAVASGLVDALGFAYTTAVGVVLYDDVRARKGEPTS